MRTVRLIACADEYDTGCGLKIVGTPDFDGFMAARKGDLIAHDVLEHVNGPSQIGDIGDECQAMGALWQVRGRHGDLAQSDGRGSRHSPAENVATDIERMFEGWLDNPLPGPITRPCDYDEDFEDILARATYLAARSREDNRPVAEFTRQLEGYLEFAHAHMRIGFRKAAKRYGGGFKGHNLFIACRDAADDVIRCCDLIEGAEFTIRFDENNWVWKDTYGDMGANV